MHLQDPPFVPECETQKPAGSLLQVGKHLESSTRLRASTRLTVRHRSGTLALSRPTPHAPFASFPESPSSSDPPFSLPLAPLIPPRNCSASSTSIATMSTTMMTAIGSHASLTFRLTGGAGSPSPASLRATTE